MTKQKGIILSICSIVLDFVLNGLAWTHACASVTLVHINFNCVCILDKTKFIILEQHEQDARASNKGKFHYKTSPFCCECRR